MKIVKSFFVLLQCFCAATAAEFPLSGSVVARDRQEAGAVSCDFNLSGYRLKVAGQEYIAGVSVRPRSSLALSVNNARHFRAFVGVDDSSHENANAVFRIVCDGFLLWESPAMRRGDKTIPAYAELTGVSRLELIAEGTTGTCANWLDAFIESDGDLRPSAIDSTLRPYAWLSRITLPESFTATNSLTVANRRFYEGVLAQSGTDIFFLSGDAVRFRGVVGLQSGSQGVLTFDLLDADGKIIWSSGKMQDSDYAKPFNLDLRAFPEFRIRFTGDSTAKGCIAQTCFDLQGALLPSATCPPAAYNAKPPWLNPHVHSIATEPVTSVSESFSSMRKARKGETGEYSMELSAEGNSCRFTLPKHWRGRETFLRVPSFGKPFSIRLNGRPLGYAEDGALGAVFHLADLREDGENYVNFIFHDVFNASEIQHPEVDARESSLASVRLESRPQLHVKKLSLKTFPRETGVWQGDWLLDVDCDLSAEGEDLSADLELRDSDGRFIAKGSAQAFGNSLHCAISVKTPHLWSAEHPALYRLAIALKNSRRKTVEALSQSVGFRQIENRNGKFLLNGEAVLIKGVTLRGGTPSDVALIKRNNINAVRTGSLPASSEFLASCDELGVYVFEEANIYANVPERLGDPNWRETLLARCVGMVERDCNHASVVGWSVHTAFDGAVSFHSRTKACFEKRDATRLSEMPSSMKIALEQKYCNAAALASCANLLHEGNGLQGVFLPSFADCAPEKKLSPQEIRWGGPEVFFDWRDPLAHCDGIVQPDRTPKPVSRELAHSWQDVTVEPVDAAQGRFSIVNRAFFTDVSEFDCTWRYEEDGKVLAHGSLGRVSVAPRYRRDVELSLKGVHFSSSLPQTAAWTFEFSLAKDCAWAKKGFVVARDQIELPCEKVAYTGVFVHGSKPLELTESETAFNIQGGCVEARVSRTTGLLESWKCDGSEWIIAPLKPECRGLVLRKVSSNREDDGTWCIIADMEAEGGARASVSYRFMQDGSLDIAFAPDKGFSAVLSTQLPPASRRVRWLGRGPWESGDGWTSSAFAGLYERDCAKLPFKYLHPGDDVWRGDVHWLEFSGGDSAGVTIEAKDSLRFAIQQLPASASTTLRIAPQNAARKWTLRLRPSK